MMKPRDDSTLIEWVLLKGESFFYFHKEGSMKKLFIYTIVLSFIFPAYCFVSPQSAVDANLENRFIEEFDDIHTPPFANPCEYGTELVKAVVASAAGTIIGGARVDGSYIAGVGTLLFILSINANLLCEEHTPFGNPCEKGRVLYNTAVASAAGTIIGGATVDVSYIVGVGSLLFILYLNENLLCRYWNN